METRALYVGVSVEATCARQRFRHALCSACVDVCPTQALELIEGKIAVSAEKCVQCASCVFVCPEEAITGVTPPLRYYRENVLIAPFSVVAPTVEELLFWHKERGISAIAMEPGHSAQWTSVVEQLNLRLHGYGEPGWVFVMPEQSDINVSRRRLFHVQRRDVRSAQVMPGKRRLQRLWPLVSDGRPVIDRQKCQLCGACWRVCSLQVLSVQEGILRINDAACTGCASCLAVCLHQAIHLEVSIRFAMTIDLITEKRICKTCHKIFLSFSDGDTQCLFCQRHDDGMLMP